MSFTMTQNLRISGGAIPAGQTDVLRATASGVLEQDLGAFTFRIVQGASHASYQMAFNSTDLFVKVQGKWRSVPVEAVTSLFPALHLRLLWQSVLLAAKVTESGLIVDRGLLREYVATPAIDQLEQLQSLTVTSATEPYFLAHAKGSVAVYLTVPASTLQRIEVKLSATDPVSSESQTVDNNVVFHQSSRHPGPGPASSARVTPGSLFS